MSVRIDGNNKTMRLLPKLSLFSVLLVTSTAVMSIFIGFFTIKGIIYDLNSQLIENDLDYIQLQIAQDYDALEQHGLQDVKVYYQKVLSKIQADFSLHFSNKENTKHGTLVFMNKDAKIIYLSQESDSIDFKLLRNKHLSNNGYS